LWRSWTLSTAAGEVLGFVLPALVGTVLWWWFDATYTRGPVLAFALLAVAWIALAPPLLLSIGVGQWCILRRKVSGAGRWLWANALGWLLGMPITFIGPALVPGDSPPAVWVGAFLACGLLMGAIVGAVTGQALCTLLATGLTPLPPGTALGPAKPQGQSGDAPRGRRTLLAPARPTQPRRRRML
jgi:hypothetical protein